jgi:hypothetical protein
MDDQGATMTTYRTGNHWGVTIVREGEPLGENGKTVGDQLVAVVVNGDQALAERICALLNAEERPSLQLKVSDLPPEVAEKLKASIGQLGRWVPATADQPKRRIRACVEAWPECETGEYDPRCCRFPKSCSATVYDPAAVADDELEAK